MNDLMDKVGLAWPQAFWLQRLSPKTLFCDFSQPIKQECYERGRPLWRAKLGKYSKWGFGGTAEEATRKAIDLAKETKVKDE